MRPAIFCLASIALALSASPANAQPLFHYERDWTIEVEGRLYGFRDVVQTPGDFYWTQVWFQGHQFTPAHYREHRWVLIFPPVAAILAARYVIRPPDAVRWP